MFVTQGLNVTTDFEDHKIQCDDKGTVAYKMVSNTPVDNRT